MTEQPPYRFEASGISFRPTKWALEITNHINPTLTDSIEPLDLRADFSATLSVDVETYEKLALAPGPLYTVAMTTCHSPRRREVTGWKPRLRRLGDIAWWEIRKHVLRRDLIETTVVTVPCCKVAASEESA